MLARILFVFISIGLIFFCFRMIKGNKELFSKKSILKSLDTLAYIALFLITVISVAVYFLKNVSVV